MTIAAVRGCCQQIVPDTRSSCIYCSVAETRGPPRPTDEKRTSLCRVQFSSASVGDEAAVVNQVAGSVSRQCKVDEGGDLELEASAAVGELARCGRRNQAIIETVFNYNFAYICFHCFHITCLTTLCFDSHLS